MAWRDPSFTFFKSVSYGSQPAFRIFACEDCGHRIRFGARHCGYCRHKAPLLNRKSFYEVTIFCSLILGTLIGLAIFG